MSLLHLGRGSQKPPPKVDGTLRLYSMEFCPYSHRMRLVLKAKNIPHDIVNINLLQKPKWYLKINPEGKVPAIDIGAEIIIESLKISEFLERKYPDPPLYSKNPVTRERDQELIQKIEPITKIFHRFFLGQEGRSPQEWVDDVASHIKVFESELSARGTMFFGGDDPGIVDYMLWPWSERSGLIVRNARVVGRKLSPETKFPLMTKWRRAMKDDPACVATANSSEKHWKFMQMMQNKIPLDFENI